MKFHSLAVDMRINGFDNWFRDDHARAKLSAYCWWLINHWLDTFDDAWQLFDFGADAFVPKIRARYRTRAKKVTQVLHEQPFDCQTNAQFGTGSIHTTIYHYLLFYDLLRRPRT